MGAHLWGSLSGRAAPTVAPAERQAPMAQAPTPFYVAALMALYYWQSWSARYGRKRAGCSTTTANLYGNRCAGRTFNADFSSPSGNPLSRRKSMWMPMSLMGPKIALLYFALGCKFFSAAFVPYTLPPLLPISFF